MKQTLKWLTLKEAEKIPAGSVIVMRRAINGKREPMFLVIETPKKKGKQ